MRIFGTSCFQGIGGQVGCAIFRCTMSLGYRCVALALGLVLGTMAVGLMRGTIPISIRGTDKEITGIPAVIAGALVAVGACRILYLALTGH